jgi:hypothetical protein
MTANPYSRILGVGLLSVWMLSYASAEERTQHFNRDPSWEGHNNRLPVEPRTVRQDFGYSLTSHTGEKLGEIGGFITAAAEPAYYAKKLQPKTFDDALSASGTLTSDGRPLHVLIGFFNSDTLNEWRTPNSICLRISGRGDVVYAWLEYATQRWRAGGDKPIGFPTMRDPKTGKIRLQGFAAKEARHRWSLQYDPNGNNSRGVLTATIDDTQSVCHLAEGHKADGARFNRFGLLNVMKSAARGGEIWLGDLAVNGDREDLSHDPSWDHLRNRASYETKIIRPFFDFGFSLTHYAGGQNAGELGGLVFRGDCRFPQRMASYADRLQDLTLVKPIHASGKVCLKRGVTDSTVLFGFFHSEISMKSNPSQDSGLPKCFLGISTDGPSREGFFFSPTYRIDGNENGHASKGQPRIFPDGQPQDWSLDYMPAGANGRGEITVTLGQQSVSLPLGAGHKMTGTRFNRFGLITTWVDGNSQDIYFDDLRYTCSQE